MRQDVAISKELRQGYEQHRLAAAPELPAVSVRILSEKVWPAHRREHLGTLPVSHPASLPVAFRWLWFSLHNLVPFPSNFRGTHRRGV